MTEAFDSICESGHSIARESPHHWCGCDEACDECSLCVPCEDHEPGCPQNCCTPSQLTLTISMDLCSNTCIHTRDNPFLDDRTWRIENVSLPSVVVAERSSNCFWVAENVGTYEEVCYYGSDSCVETEGVVVERLEYHVHWVAYRSLSDPDYWYVEARVGTSEQHEFYSRLVFRAKFFYQNCDPSFSVTNGDNMPGVPVTNNLPQDDDDYPLYAGCDGTCPQSNFCGCRQFPFTPEMSAVPMNSASATVETC